VFGTTPRKALPATPRNGCLAPPPEGTPGYRARNEVFGTTPGHGPRRERDLEQPGLMPRPRPAVARYGAAGRGVFGG